MEETRFKIVFEKLYDARQGMEFNRENEEIQQLREESEEIRELSRLAVEVAMQEPKSYTTT